MKNILLAGATGYLGRHVATVLGKGPYRVRAIVRRPAALRDAKLPVDEVLAAEMTRPETIRGCCDGMDAVISTVGITRQRDGMTYMQVDYQANLNLLHEAIASGVKRFIYVSLWEGERLRHLKICAAKERFVDQLKASGLDYCIIRPTGFFSDMADYFRMAKRGRSYLLGDGEKRINPIHGEDVARLCVDAIEAVGVGEICAGGPDILTHKEIACEAFAALKSEPRIHHLPSAPVALLLALMRRFSSSKTYGPIEFFVTVMGRDMVAPRAGRRRLRAHFERLAQ